MFPFPNQAGIVSLIFPALQHKQIYSIETKNSQIVKIAVLTIFLFVLK